MKTFTQDTYLVVSKKNLILVLKKEGTKDVRIGSYIASLIKNNRKKLVKYLIDYRNNSKNYYFNCDNLSYKPLEYKTMYDVNQVVLICSKMKAIEEFADNYFQLAAENLPPVVDEQNELLKRNIDRVLGDFDIKADMEDKDDMINEEDMGLDYGKQ